MAKRKSLGELDPVTFWAEQVEAEKIVAGPHIRDAARRHLSDLDLGAARGLKWDVAAAHHVIDWFGKYLKLSGGEFQGRPFIPHPSQAFRLGSLFGWKMENGDRRFRVCYDEEGKGNGKSPFLAGIGMYGLCSIGRARAEIYAAASKVDQARIVFTDAVAMRDMSPELANRVSCRGKNPVNTLLYAGAQVGDKRIFKCISSDDKQSGLRPQISLIDELHEHRNRRVLSMQERGLNKNPVGSLMAIATNAGHDRTSLCWERHQHAIRVAAGDIPETAGDRTFAFVCSMDEGDDWLNDESCWEKANPLLDVTVTREALREATQQARSIPGTLNEIARLHFCEWTESHTVWIPRNQIEACEDDFNLDEFKNAECVMALDLSIRRDMTAKALIFEDGQTPAGEPCFAIWTHGYLPKGVLADREREDDAPYSQWVQEGHISAVGDNKVDYDAVAAKIAEDARRFHIKKLVMDMHLGDFFFDSLGACGLDDLELVGHPQGWNKGRDTPLFMPHSIALFEQLIAEGRLRIKPNPALRAAIMSVVFKESPAGLRRFDKHKVTARIDLAVVAAMAVGAMNASLEEKPRSPWEDESFRLMSA